ncbi:MAG: hypothetical protein KA746_13645 [Pyrinomonadaceae bacterium]|nr:hypothetical protein [Pyrinomonadaceae bacterium]MBP6214075.1 hypothetical protein [Pyrinomonadaceae bacterium]
MNSKLWIRKAISSCLMIAMLATYSMVALANTGKATGELVVNGGNVVTVNGEAAKSGRTIFTSSTVSTPENTSAIINLGTIGQIEMAPNTAMTVSFDAKSASLDLTTGTVTVLKSATSVNVNTGGTNYALNAGETATAQVGKAAQKDDDDDKDAAWWPFALIFGGAAVGIIWAASRGGNDVSLGGGTIVVSPNR